jgi:hypothetical protein
MCFGCSARLRLEWNLPPLPVAVGRYRLHGGLVRAAAMAVMVVGVTLAASPLDELRLVRSSLQPPQTVLVPPAPVPPAPVDEEMMPSLAVAHVPRRLAPRIISAPVAASYLAVTVAHTPMPPVTEWAERDVLSGIALASLPHAGLTQQTP